MSKIYRIYKEKNYTIMSNYHLQSKELSYKAKGLLSYMLTLPDDWIFSVNGLIAVSKESKKAINSTLKELEQHYYLKRTKKHQKDGRIYYDYEIYEFPYN